MPKAIIIGRELDCDGRYYDIDSVVKLTLSGDAVAVEFLNGDSIKMDADPILFYSIGDCCPWATKILA